MGLISGSGRSTGGGNGSPLQYACLTSQGQRSLVGYSPWGHKESDTTEGLDSDKTPNKHLCLLRELQEQMNWRLQGVKAVGREAILMTSWERDGKLTSRYHRHISVICSFKLPKVITERLSPLLLKSLPREFYALCIDRLCACVSDTEETTCTVENNAPFKQAEQVLIQGSVVLLLCLHRKPFMQSWYMEDLSHWDPLR